MFVTATMGTWRSIVQDKTVYGRRENGIRDCVQALQSGQEGSRKAYEQVWRGSRRFPDSIRANSQPQQGE